MTNQVTKCRICGELYEFMAMMVGDQSVCPSCRAKAKANMGKPFRLDPDKVDWMIRDWVIRTPGSLTR